MENLHIEFEFKHFTSFKVDILQLYLFASATQWEVESGAAAVRLYLTKEYLSVASD